MEKFNALYFNEWFHAFSPHSPVHLKRLYIRGYDQFELDVCPTWIGQGGVRPYSLPQEALREFKEFLESSQRVLNEFSGSSRRGLEEFPFPFRVFQLETK